MAETQGESSDTQTMEEAETNLSEPSKDYLKSPAVDDYINSVTYGVKMPRVNTETMENLAVPIPPLEEQQRIVEKLDALLPLCDDLAELA